MGSRNFHIEGKLETISPDSGKMLIHISENDQRSLSDMLKHLDGKKVHVQVSDHRVFINEMGGWK